MRKFTLNPRQESFITNYIQLGNGTQAAIKAGYSAKQAKKRSCALLDNPNVYNEIKRRMQAKRDKDIAQEDEVLMFLTKVMRGQFKEEQIVIEGQGDGYSTARVIKRKIQINDRIHAAKELHKRYLSPPITDTMDDNKEEANAQNAVIDAIKERAQTVEWLEDD